jgi:hypothetical protein
MSQLAEAPDPLMLPSKVNIVARGHVSRISHTTDSFSLSMIFDASRRLLHPPPLEILSLERICPLLAMSASKSFSSPAHRSGVRDSTAVGLGLAFAELSRIAGSCNQPQT